MVLMEPPYDVREVIEAGASVPSVVAGQLVERIGDERDLRGADVADEFHEGFPRVALDIELGGDDPAQVIDIAASDMPLIGAGVDGDALRAESFAVACKAEHIGHVSSARIAQSRHLIYIDAQSCQDSLLAWLMPQKPLQS